MHAPKNQHILSSVPRLSTTSTHWKPMQSRKLYFPRAGCQFQLLALPTVGLWRRKKPVRFPGTRRCLSTPHTRILYSHTEGQEQGFFFLFFPPRPICSTSVGFSTWGCQLPVGHTLLLPALLKGKQHMTLRTLFSFGPGGKGVTQCSRGRWFSGGVSEMPSV